MKKLFLTLLPLLLFCLLATSVMAGKNCGNCVKRQLDPVAASLQEKYAEEYAAIEAKVQAKQDELNAAWSKEETTVGQINRLRNEMLELKKEYLHLNEKVQQEYSAAQNDTQAQVAGKADCPCPGCERKGNCKAQENCPKQGCKKGAQMGCQGEGCPQQQCRQAQDCPNREACDGQGRKCRGVDDCPKRS